MHWALCSGAYFIMCRFIRNFSSRAEWKKISTTTTRRNRTFFALAFVRDYANRQIGDFHTGLHLSYAYCALSVVHSLASMILFFLFILFLSLSLSFSFSLPLVRIELAAFSPLYVNTKCVCVDVHVCEQLPTFFQLNNLNNEQQKMLSKAIKSTRTTFDVHFLTHYRFCRKEPEYEQSSDEHTLQQQHHYSNMVKSLKREQKKGKKQEQTCTCLRASLNCTLPWQR